MPARDFRGSRVSVVRLDVFSQKKLHEALTGAGYDVSLRTVRRWIEGEATPNSAWERAIVQVIGAQQETPPQPEWLEGLAGDIARKVIAELTTSRENEMGRLIDDLEQRLAQRSEAPPVRTDTADQDG